MVQPTLPYSGKPLPSSPTDAAKSCFSSTSGSTWTQEARALGKSNKLPFRTKRHSCKSSSENTPCEVNHLTSERDCASLSSNQSPTYYSCFSNPPVPSSNHWVCTSPALRFFQVPTQHLLFWPCPSLRLPTFHIFLDTEGFSPYHDGFLCVHGVRTARWNSPGLWHLVEVQLNPSCGICHLWPWARYVIVSSVVDNHRCPGKLFQWFNQIIM